MDISEVNDMIDGLNRYRAKFTGPNGLEYEICKSNILALEYAIYCLEKTRASLEGNKV